MTVAASRPELLLVAGIGEMVLTRDPAMTLVAYGLGSCVGLGAWDPVTKVGGLAHFMLPAGTPGGAPVKFIEGGLESFLAAFEREGGNRRRAKFKAAGGAAMLTAMAVGGLDIGRRNGEAVAARLSALGLQLHASDFGGKAGRTVQLSPGDGRFLVKSVTSSTVL